MNTYANLRDKVAAFTHRSPDVFNYNGQDLLLQAANNAKNFAQRVVDFELSRVFTQLPNVSPTAGASLSGLLLFGTGVGVVPKSLEQAFFGTATSQYPVDFVSRDAYVNRLRRRYEASDSTTLDWSASPAVVQVGNTIYFTPPSGSASGQSQTIYFDAIQWLPDFEQTTLTGVTTSTSAGNLVDTTKNFVSAGIRPGDVVTKSDGSGATATVVAVTNQSTLSLSADIFTVGQSYSIGYVNGSQTNFLLDYCFDYMMFRTIYELNFYLKEDSRVVLSDKLMGDIWENVQKWNSTIVGNSTNDNSLD